MQRVLLPRLSPTTAGTQMTETNKQTNQHFKKFKSVTLLSSLSDYGAKPRPALFTHEPVS